MKKRLVSTMLATVMAFSLVACGSSNEPQETPAAEEAPAQEEAAAEAPAEESEAEEAAGDVNATVIWRAFDDQFQSGFRIIMQNEEEKIGGISLDMQDAANDVSTAISKLEASLTKGTDVVAICAPDRESTETMAQKCDEEGVPAVFFNMEPMETTMENYENICYVGAEAKESGEMCAQALINYWNANTELADKNGDGVLQLVILQGEIGQQDVVLRTQAYEETLTAQGIEYEILAMDTCKFSLRMTKKQKSEKSRKNLTNAEKLRVSGIQTTQKCHS